MLTLDFAVVFQCLHYCSYTEQILCEVRREKSDERRAAVPKTRYNAFCIQFVTKMRV